MKTFENKTAIITGGASGIGLALGKALVRHGARVVLADVNADGADAAAEELGQSASSVCVDVTDAVAVQGLVEETAESHGQLDYMFNNAGIFLIGDVLDMDLDQWNRLVDINVRGVIHGVVAAYPIMVEQGFGHIVNVASVSGLMPSPRVVAYSATKHAVVGLSVGLRAEAAGFGVKVSAVCPGLIDTPIKQNATYVNTDHETEAKSVPVGFYSADACARDILRGVKKNQRIIVMPSHGKLVAGIYKWVPRLYERIAIRELKKVRARS